MPVRLASFGLFLGCAAGALLEGAPVVRVGAAQRVVTPDLALHAPVYMAGFGQNRKATGIHDDLFVRCLAISVGKRDPLLICGLDSIGLFWDDVLRFRKGLAAKRIRVAGSVIAASHSHQAPDTMGLWGAGGKTGINEAYSTLVIERAVEAAAEAVQNAREARLRIATVESPELDSFIRDSRPPDRHDAGIIALEAADAKTGKPIATLVNWANHPEALASRNTLISADYVASLRTHLEKLRGGGIAIFANGAVGGMQSPLGAKVPGDLQDGTFEKAEYIGTRVAELTSKGLDAASADRIVDAIDFREKVIRIPLENPGFQEAMKADLYGGRKPLNSDGTVTTVAGMFRLRKGNSPVLECALIPGEMYPELSLGGVERYSGADFPDAAIEKPIKSMMAAPYRMLFGLANDENGYIIPKSEWDAKEPWLNGAKKRWYGEVNSIGPEIAPILAKTVEELFRGK